MQVAELFIIADSGFCASKPLLHFFFLAGAVTFKVLRLFLLTTAAVYACAAQSRFNPANLPRGTVYAEAQNISFHIIDGVVLRARRLDGYMIPRPGKVVSLDDKKSFTLQIMNAETYISEGDLSALLNTYILPHAQTSVHNVAVHFEGQTVIVKGSMRKGISVPFEGKGNLSVTPEGDLRIHFTDLTAAGVLKKGLLDALGIKLQKVAQPRHQPSFQIQGDDITVSVMRLFPPPHIAGKLVSVRIEGDELVQIFGKPDAPFKAVPVPRDRFIYFRGGTVAFGKLTMRDANLELTDTGKTNSFDFSLDHYHQQLEAGYSKSTPDLGLVVYAADYSTLASKK